MISLTSTDQKALNATYRFLMNSASARKSEVKGYWEAAKESQKGSPPDFSNPSGFGEVYLAYNLVRKDEVGLYGAAINNAELEKKAVSGFLLDEHALKHVNLYGRSCTPSPTGYPLAPEPVIHLARRKIAYALGKFCPDEMVERSHFSSGASTRLRRTRGQPPFKFQGVPHVTRNCALLAVTMMWHSPVWRAYCQDLHGRDSDPCTWVSIVRGSEYFTVPKTFDSVRGAAKEPDLNMYLQKGIGEMIRKRLKRVGVNLDDQTLNQHLALVGSRTGSLATIDLAAASDSVSTRLVLDLLPHDWVRFINYTRSPEIRLPDGSWHFLEKISSMGNGFTFELESLIFWALSSACVELTKVEDKRIGIYGDDIIVHHSVAPALISVLSYVGFNTNNEKTHISGPFRESCGKHYVYGCDVSPFNVKQTLESQAERYHYFNRLNLWGCRMGYGECPEFLGLLRYLERLFFPKGSNVVPPHYGTKAGKLVPSVRHAAGVHFCFKRQGYTGFRLATTPPRRGRRPEWPAYMAWYMACSGSVFITQSTKESGWKRRRFYTSEWADCEVSLP